MQEGASPRTHTVRAEQSFSRRDDGGLTQGGARWRSGARQRTVTSSLLLHRSQPPRRREAPPVRKVTAAAAGGA